MEKNNPTHVVDEQQKVQELLKPRYKLIAGYPKCEEPVGTIFYETDELAFAKYRVWHYIMNDCTFGTWNRSFEKYPHIFKPLEWWEERSFDEMPQYIKTDDIVFKVDYYECLENDDAVAWFVKGSRNAGSCLRANTFPATEQDYLTYQNQNNAKSKH